MEKFFIGNKLMIKLMDLTSHKFLAFFYLPYKLSSVSFIDKGNACKKARILFKVTIKLTSFREKPSKYNVLFLGIGYMTSMCCLKSKLVCTTGGSLYTGYLGVYGPKGYGFLAVLVINRLSILAILGSIRVGFIHSSCELGMFFLEEATFPSS